MASASNPILDMLPFPQLEWSEYFWETLIPLPSWKGFQNRTGPYASTRSKKPSDGRVRLSIAPKEDEPPSIPAAEQAAAYEFLMKNEAAIHKLLLRAIFKVYPEERAAYYEGYDLDDDDPALPVIKRPEELRDLMGLSSVHIHNVFSGGVAYVGFEFGCAWEEEHGCGVMMHKKRIVKVGQADTAILEWIAEEDAAR